MAKIYNNLQNNVTYDEEENINDLYFLPGSLGEMFNKDNEIRQCFDNSLYLNNKIIQLDKNINKLRSDKIKEFKKKYNLNDPNDKDKYKNELIYAALFGNGISVI